MKVRTVRADGSVGAGELAEAFACNLKTIHNWCDQPAPNGRRTTAMPHWKTAGGHFRFDPREIVKWCEQSGIRVSPKLQALAGAAAEAVVAA